MKLTLDSYRDYLFIVRLLTSSSHEPGDLIQIVNSIDTSTLVIKTSIEDIAMEFTLSEIVELKKNSDDLIKLAKEISNNSLLIMIEDFRLLSCLAQEGGDSRMLRWTKECENRRFLQFGKVFWIK